LNDECGATGVIQQPLRPRRDDRAARPRVVPPSTRRGGHDDRVTDQDVADERFPLHPQRHTGHCRRPGPRPSPRRCTRCSSGSRHRWPSPIPAAHHVFASTDHLQRGRQVRHVDLGEEAQPAQVDAKHTGTLGRSPCARRAAMVVPSPQADQQGSDLTAANATRRPVRQCPRSGPAPRPPSPESPGGPDPRRDGPPPRRVPGAVQHEANRAELRRSRGAIRARATVY